MSEKISLNLSTYYADLHVHIGATSEGRPVKISASRNLTFEAISREAADRKGIDLIGIIDAQSPGVLADIDRLIAQGEMEELPQGGIRYKNTTILLGSEIEIKPSGKGTAHVLCYMPSLEAMKRFSQWMSAHMRNIHLSTQRIYVEAEQLQQEVAAYGGVFVPAHIFTPHKSIYGSCTDRMEEVLDMQLVDAVEVGLSADRDMAARISELDPFPLLTNSDAHSLSKIGREYNAFRMAEPNFAEWCKVLRKQEGRSVASNYGLNPRLGKYHRTTCGNGHFLLEEDHLSRLCPTCGSKIVIGGVFDRISSIADRSVEEAVRPDHTPYIH
ncbi:endonuclease Q family protein [Paenibacillus sp. SC116]|uniref:endonuclease Q family protein n=1 Tax=Paenibacillus sp. SC116 TaxID=2968986 RepID=UPI002811C40A|nr:endonuclease Q family protein [Paenibacillus sp. SC116]